jgi:hypothetical protein
MLEAHTIAEIALYLKVIGCEQCGRTRQWHWDSPQPPEVPGDITVHTQCVSCEAQSDVKFHVHHRHEPATTSRPASINPTDRPSRLIDLGQWITLAHLLIEESRGKKDKEYARFQNLQAGQCYDEALKFYDDPDNELPPAEAFFTDASRTRFKSSPQQFARSRLIGERVKLPTPYNG